MPIQHSLEFNEVYGDRMGDRDLQYSLDCEARGQNISIGNEETESNGHIGNCEPIGLVETKNSMKGNAELQS